MLRYKADLRTLAMVTLFFGMAAGGWLLYDRLPIWAIAPWVIITAFVSFFCAVIVHNTIHCPIFKSRNMNRFFQVILSFTYGHSVSAYVPGHNYSHHKYLQSKKDVMRTYKARFRWNFLNQALFFFIMSGDLLRDEVRFAKVLWKTNRKWVYGYLFELALVIGVKVTLLILDPIKAILFVWLPHQYAVWGIVSTNYWQHEGCDVTHRYNHSRNFTGKFLNFVAFNNGYHGMPHEKPGLHWSLLPTAHEKELAPHLHPNLNQKSLLKYLWRSCVYPGKRVDYLGNPPVLPPRDKDEDWVQEASGALDLSQLGAAES